ncbi:DivIVA domain-containing protein [Fonticella tunisiensis]|uniref:Cell division initiation protein n=1 Tax=Fonticella tunisiensis TaxID=1096341 RepID=A0A4R7KSN7_9CLOT|nr:DivIVA domain-containing protein [Fonticella tunisiensis]TDT61835.1 cell division initiation protein [Fonticella tunisiensis]
MTITPNEISNKEFKRVFRGYDMDEVDEFLEQILDDYEKLYKENITLKEKITSLNEKIEHYANMESTLQNTLLLAQTAADQAKESSRREGEMIIKNAKDKAAEIIREAENSAAEINKKNEILKQEYNMFRSRFKALLEAQIEAIDRAGIELSSRNVEE